MPPPSDLLWFEICSGLYDRPEPLKLRGLQMVLGDFLRMPQSVSVTDRAASRRLRPS
jgi:hypothetical protein